jgi:hypothetical protein
LRRKELNIDEAQREIRTVFLGGFAGQLVSGLIWLASAMLSTWVAPKYGMIGLFLGGVFIFPLTQLVLRVLGRNTKLSARNSLNQLATQIAFTVPISFLLVGAATLAHQEWFYPAAMIAVGIHYLPFCFLYGMWQFALLAGLMIGGGLLFAQYLPVAFSTGGWITGMLLLIAAVVGLYLVFQEQRQQKLATM